MRCRVAVVVLTWNGWDDTARCLKSIEQHEPDLPVVLVDNGSTDETVDTVKEKFPRVVVLENQANLGYAGGNNVGIRYALRRGFEFIVVLNNDTEIGPGFLPPLLAAAEENGVGAVSPVIKYRDRDEIWFGGMNREPRTGIPVHVSLLRSDPVTLSGCCLFARREVWERCGVFDERYFLIFEDADWSERVRRAGYTLRVEPRSVITHAVSASLERTSASWGDFYFIRNGLLYLETYSGSGRVLKMLRFTYAHVGRQVLSREILTPSSPARMRASGLAAYLRRQWGQNRLHAEDGSAETASAR